MKNKKLLLPFISLVLIAFFSVQAAFIYQKIEGLFQLKEYQVPVGNWHQGLTSAFSQVGQYQLPAVTVNAIPNHKVKTHKKISFNRKSVKYQRITYKKQLSDKKVVRIKTITLSSRPLQYSSVTPRAENANSVSNEQLIVLSGFNWTVDHFKLNEGPLAIWNRLQGEQKLLALEATRIAEENQQRLAVVLPQVHDEAESSDSVSAISSATTKDLPELKVDSDLDHAAVKDIPTVTEDLATVPAQAVAEVVEDQIALEKAQQKVWNEWKSENLSEVSNSVAMAIASAKSQVNAKSKNHFVALSRDYSRRPAQVTTQEQRGVTIQVTAAKMGKGFERELSNFEFNPNYDSRGTGLHDLEGKILLENTLSSRHSLISGKIIKDGYLPLNVDLALNKDEELVDFNLPLIDINDYGDFLDKLKLMGEGAHLLVELAEGVVDVELDTAYESKLFLNGDLKVVKADEDYQFVLIVGAKIGNSLMSYINADGDTADRIVFLEDATVTYDNSAIQTASKMRFKLTQQSPFSVKPEVIDLDERDIRYFNQSAHADQFAPGVYDLKRPIHAANYRHYFELSHIEGSIFVGVDQSKEIEVPNVSLMSEALKELQIESLDGQCVVQLNLRKKAYSIKYEGRIPTGGMPLETLYLEKNGKFETEISPITRKVFINGQGQGVLDIKVEYLDDTVDYLQTFCSNGTYLVEQL